MAASRRLLVLGLNRVFEVKDHQVGVAFTRMDDGARVTGRQEQQSP